jgi:hypothetical protein
MTQMAVAFHSPDTDLEIDLSTRCWVPPGIRSAWCDERVTRATSVVDRIGSLSLANVMLVAETSQRGPMIMAGDSSRAM